MDYVSVKEMMKPDTKMPWGNRFGFLHIQISKLLTHPVSNSLDFVRYACSKSNQEEERSLAVYLNGRLLELINIEAKRRVKAYIINY